MKAFLSLAVAASISLSEALIYNKTAAYAPGQYEKYKCITTEDINDMFTACLRQCQRDANSQDGCAYNDFACHCANYDTYSPVRIPFYFASNVFPPLTQLADRRELRIPTRARWHRQLHPAGARPGPYSRHGLVQLLQRDGVHGVCGVRPRLVRRGEARRLGWSQGRPSRLGRQEGRPARC